MKAAEEKGITDENDIGTLLSICVKHALGHEWYAEQADALLRRYWPVVVPYYQRRIICDIEVALVLDGPEERGARQPMAERARWEKIIADLRPPKAPYTVDYHCHKCKARDVKLWRGVHGCADEDGHELLCARCLTTDPVDVDGRAKSKSEYSDGMLTDQIAGWLPAVPVDDTYWGYTSVPSADVEWWRALPTYPAGVAAGCASS